MTLFELIEKTCEQHTSFKESMQMSIESQIHQYVLKHPELTRYDACQQVIAQILSDGTGSLVDTYLN